MVILKQTQLPHAARLATISQQLRGILIVSLLRALSSALLSPIIALFLKQFFPTDFLVSLIITFSYLFDVIATVYSSVIIEYLQKRKTMILGLVLYTVVLILFTISESSHAVLLLFVLYSFLFTLLFFGISMYIDKLSSRENIAKNFGENGVLLNIGWVVGPMLAGLIAEKFSFIEVFLLASLFSFIALLIFVFSEPAERRHPEHHHVYIFRNIKNFFRADLTRRLYWTGLGFSIFYGASAMIPLQLMHLGGTISQIGIIIGLASLPWIILELPVGKWADKTKKEPRLFFLTYTLLAPAIFLLGLVRSLPLAFIFLLLTSVATALSETTIQSYFYRKFPQNSISLVSVFLTYSSFGLFLGTCLTTVALTIMPLSSFYMLLGVLLIPFIINALRLEKSTLSNPKS